MEDGSDWTPNGHRKIEKLKNRLARVNQTGQWDIGIILKKRWTHVRRLRKWSGGNKKADDRQAHVSCAMVYNVVNWIEQ